ncbi:MAG: hypothetical protein RLZZ371_560 [Pseudomonadota bacterium]
MLRHGDVRHGCIQARLLAVKLSLDAIDEAWLPFRLISIRRFGNAASGFMNGEIEMRQREKYLFPLSFTLIRKALLYV